MILLFNPPAPDGRGYTREGRCTQDAGVWGTQWPPLSLATAAALLRQDGRQVILRDYPAEGLDNSALVDDLHRLQPALVCWSTGTPTLSSDIAVAALVKAHAPAALTAVLGTHVSVLPEAALAEPHLDVVIRGEPEGVIRKLCGSAPDVTGVAGISYRDRSAGAHGGAVRHNPDAVPLSPEDIPAPSWEGIDPDAYRLPLRGRRFLMVAPVRGCPYRCTFCTAPLYYGRRLRRRPAAQVIEEIINDINLFNIREFFFWADTFTADRSYVQEFCRALIARNLGISWSCNSRVDTVDAETLALMKEAGLWMISYGLESGNDGVLAASRKGITVAQSRAAVELSHRMQVLTTGHFIFGLPGETEDTMEESLDFAMGLPLDFAQFYAAAPFPGTELYDTALRHGWLGSNAGSADGISQRNAVMELPGLASARVEAFRRQAFRRFYLRPGKLWRMLSLMEPRAAARMIPAWRSFLRWTG